MGSRSALSAVFTRRASSARSDPALDSVHDGFVEWRDSALLRECDEGASNSVAASNPSAGAIAVATNFKRRRDDGRRHVKRVERRTEGLPQCTQAPCCQSIRYLGQAQLARRPPRRYPSAIEPAPPAACLAYCGSTRFTLTPPFVVAT